MKIGEYVRTKDGIILKIKDIEDIYTTDNEYIGMAIYDNKGHFVNDVEIIKSSPKIIDLIQVGDYVNGDSVSFVGADSIEVFWYKDEKQWLDKEDIKSIVTREQFSQMEYKVKE